MKKKKKKKEKLYAKNKKWKFRKPEKNSKSPRDV